MSQEIEKKEDAGLDIVKSISFLSEIESVETTQQKFKILDRVLNQAPVIKKNLANEMRGKGINAGAAQNFDYVPVGVVEEALRQIFFRQVDFVIKKSYRDLNSFIVHARIKYKDPITHENRTIDGIGAKSLQQDKGAKVHEFNTTMKSNALEMGVAIAYSRAIKNAAKKLGKLFGANLNRDDELDNVVVFNKKALNA